MSETTAKAYGYMKDALTIAVVPLVVLLWQLSSHSALQSERIENLKSEVSSLRADQAKVDRLREDLQTLAIQQARIEGKVESANARLDQIKSLLGGK